MPTDEFEVIILGCGPAGIQAAVHAARSKVKVLLLGRFEGSSLYNAYIENYCCINNVSGNDLLKGGVRQAEESGAVFMEKDCIEIKRDGTWIHISAEDGAEYIARALIFSLGVSRKKLKVAGEEEFLGKGVSYCVDCDANFFKNMPVGIIGSGSAAASGALLMADYTDEVHLISENLDVSPTLKAKLAAKKIIIHEKKVTGISGERSVNGITMSDGSSLPLKGVFIELGAKGVIELAASLGIMMDESFKYIDVNRKQETNIPGIYAAGDICGPPWQVAKAVGEGCVAGLEAAKYARKFRE